RRTESMRTASGASSPSWGSEPCEADCQRAVFEVGVSTGLNFDLYRDIRGLVDRRGVAGAVDTPPRPPPGGAGATSDRAPDATAMVPRAGIALIRHLLAVEKRLAVQNRP